MCRSGSFSSRGQEKRQLKSQGTSKIDNICSAHMKVQQNIHTNKVVVTYVSKHWNHKMQLAHLPIPQSARLSIASHLQQGVPILTILDKIRDGESAQLGREHLINPQEIHNIRRQLNLYAVEKHRLDTASILHWVTELKQQDYDPVLCYKSQGEESDNLRSDDFLLGGCIKFLVFNEISGRRLER